MDGFQLLASPWWVNLGYLIPAVSYFLWRIYPISVSRWKLLYAALFGIAFGINEAVVVVYLRAATGLLPGFEHGLPYTAEALNLYQQSQLLNTLPQTLVTTEIMREVATLVILVSLSLAIAGRIWDRWAFFLWMFAFWDIFYYAGLSLIVRWPPSLLTPDILFLTPVPWVAQVWFPLLVSLLSIGAVALSVKIPSESKH